MQELTLIRIKSKNILLAFISDVVIIFTVQMNSNFILLSWLSRVSSFNFIKLSNLQKTWVLKFTVHDNWTHFQNAVYHLHVIRFPIISSEKVNEYLSLAAQVL